MVPRAGREAVWEPLCEIYHDLVLLECNCRDEIDEIDRELIHRYKSCAGEVSKGLSNELMAMFDRLSYSPSHDLTRLVKPSCVLKHVDKLFLAFDDGWMLIKKKDFDKKLKYSRCTRGLVKLALK